MPKSSLFLVQRQRRNSIHYDWQNYGDVEETTKEELQAAWAGDRGVKRLWLSDNPTQLQIICDTIRDIVLGEDSKEVEALCRALRTAPLQ